MVVKAAARLPSVSERKTVADTTTPAGTTISCLSALLISDDQMSLCVFEAPSLVAQRLPLAPGARPDERIGELVFRGALHLTSDDRRFGVLDNPVSHVLGVFRVPRDAVGGAIDQALVFLKDRSKVLKRRFPHCIRKPYCRHVLLYWKTL